MTPFSFTIVLNASQVTAARQKLGVPSSQMSGTESNAKGVVDWVIVPTGVMVTVKQLNGFAAAHAPHGLIEQQIREMFGA